MISVALTYIHRFIRKILIESMDQNSLESRKEKFLIRPQIQHGTKKLLGQQK